MELHARTRRDLEADPEFDPICALFYCISSDTILPNSDKMDITGAIVIDRDRTRTISSQGSSFIFALSRNYLQCIHFITLEYLQTIC